MDKNKIANRGGRDFTDPATHFGLDRAGKIHKSGKQYSLLSGYEKFTLENGWRYRTEDALQAGYKRFCKAKRQELISEEEFLIEAGSPEGEDAKRTYAALLELARKRRLGVSCVYDYAHFKWCLQSPEAVVAYQASPGRWLANTCSTEISQEKAILTICREYGFEAGRILLVGTPYYDAADWNFIRFDCGGYCWLAKDGSLFQLFGE